jgi:hypothetical protein
MERRAGAGRKRGSKSKRTIGRELAAATAKKALPAEFTSNALALLQMVYRNPTLELRVRLGSHLR